MGYFIVVFLDFKGRILQFHQFVSLFRALGFYRINSTEIVSPVKYLFYPSRRRTEHVPYNFITAHKYHQVTNNMKLLLFHFNYLHGNLYNCGIRQKGEIPLESPFNITVFNGGTRYACTKIIMTFSR